MTKTYRVVCISDTHNQHESIVLPPGDILIHAGDATSAGSLREFQRFGKWLSAQRYSLIVATPGNHDWLAQEDSQAAQNCFTGPVKYLIHEAFEWEGLKFFGSPWSVEFNNWAFNYPEAEASELWSAIPDGTEVLVTHGPPHLYGDVLGPLGSKPGTHVGCPELLRAVDRIKPLIHCCGHIHTGADLYERGRTTIVNASQLDDRYAVVNEPFIIDIEVE